MDNPFLKRATEFFYHDTEAFLAVVSPEPLTHFLSQYAAGNQLYEKLLIIEGTPGSGKTTLAQLFEYSTISTMLRNIDTYRPLYSALNQCGAISNDTAKILGCRLSLESDYREFWDFDYPEHVKIGLMTTLLQARAVLAWIHNLSSAGIDLSNVTIVTRENTVAATKMIGGSAAIDLQIRAQEVELTVYKVIASLVAPDLSELKSAVMEAYRPFDVIEAFRISINTDGEIQTRDVKPLLILDDAHILHPNQFLRLRHWLIRRELRIARWIMTRLDVLQPNEALEVLTEEHSSVNLPGITKERDEIHLMLQTGVDRGKQRSMFRKFARDMADRYLGKMPLFSSRGHRKFADLLSSNPSVLTLPKRKELEAGVAATQKALNIVDSRRAELLKSVEKYHHDGRKLPDDVKLSMLRILMHRYAKRTGSGTLFDMDPEPTRPIEADSGVFEAACLALLHNFNRPFFFGMDDLCDASSENAEQFLHLAAILVDAAEVHLIRSKPLTLDAATQHKLLTQCSSDFIQDWEFPHHHNVRNLVKFIAERCLTISLEPNAWIGSGANAYGILQNEFDQIPTANIELATMLQFAVAYNAISLIPNYSCKRKTWCLLELGGVAKVKYGLTLKRGGFVEGKASELIQLLNGVLV